MQKVVTRIELPRKDIQSKRHFAYIVLRADDAQELASDILDLTQEYPNLELLDSHMDPTADKLG